MENNLKEKLSKIYTEKDLGNDKKAFIYRAPEPHDSQMQNIILKDIEKPKCETVFIKKDAE